VKRQLTLAVVVGLCIFAALAVLIADVEHGTGLARADQPVDEFFTHDRGVWSLRIFLWVTAIGAGPSLTAMLCTATALLWRTARAPLLVPLWVTFLGAQATTWSSKYIIARPRPVFLPNITEWNPSFPSGHATASTALIGMLGYVVASGIVPGAERAAVVACTVALIGLICFSRLFLGVHFLTDVTAGVLVGMLWLLVGISLAAAASRRGRKG
jgi:membrane-associated phospholipid phosphatase